MNTKLLTCLAMAAALTVAQPAFARSNREGAKGGGHSHAVASASHKRGAVRVASASHNRGTRVATRRAYAKPAARNVASTRRGNRQHATVAFGGNAYNSPAYANNNGGNRNETYAFRSHAGWSHDREYTWNGHHYRWYNNAWFIVDPYPYGYGAYNTDSVGAQVQSELLHDGYYQGPVDGFIGPGTRAAIAAFQRDNGLRVTGTITRSLLSYMGIA